MSWTLTSGATTQDVAAWGISGLRRVRNSQALDLVTFAIEGIAFDATAPIAADTVISIAKDGTTWFRGRVVAVRRSATGRDERLSYEVAGPWWYLEQLVYQQPWAIQGAADAWKSHCLLNITKTGTPWTTRDQIDDALAWCSARATAAYGSAPFQWVKANLPAIAIPTDEVRDVTCAEVMRKELRWMPDAVCWWDYTTNPPTLHVVRRSGLSGTSIALGAPIVSAQFEPRYDLQVSAVALKFETLNTIDGQPIAAVTTQVYPGGATGDEFGALVATIDLQGGIASYARATIVSSAIPASSPAWIAWLQTKHPTLADSRVTISSLVSVSRQKVGDPMAALLGYELIDGQLPSWSGADSQHEVVTLRVQYSVKDSAGSVVVDQRDEVFNVNITTCSVASGTFTILAEFEAGEAAPAGLAQVLYDALHPLEWEGSLELTESECSGSIALGQTVSVTGGRTEWTTMAAVVQSTEELVDDGRTVVRFGPPQHLGPRDLIELLRVNRFRLRITPQSVRSTGGASAGSITLGESLPSENATRGLAERKFHSVMSGSTRVDIDAQTNPQIALTTDAGSTKTVEILGSSSARIRLIGSGGQVWIDTSGLDGNTIEFREIAVCVGGVEKRMLLLCSEPYDP